MTLHHIKIRSVRQYSMKGGVCDFTSHNNWKCCVCDSMRLLTVWFLVADRCVMAARMLHGACVGGKAAARNLVFFRVVAAAGDGSYLVCAASAGWL